MNKDWSDAVRESCYKEEIHPSDSGWEGLTRKMHRDSVRRTAATVLAILAIPAAGLFMLPPQADHSIQIVSGTSGHDGLLLSSYEPDLVESPVEGPSKPAVLKNRTSGQSAKVTTPDITEKPVPDNSATAETGDSATGYEAVPTESKPKADNNHHKQTQDQPDPFRFPDEEAQKHKAVHSVKLFGGSGLAATANNMQNPTDYYGMTGDGYMAAGIKEELLGSSYEDEYHYIPFSIGISALFRLYGPLYFETGLALTQNSTKYSYYYAAKTWTATKQTEETWRIRYIGLPVKLDYVFRSDNRLSYMIGAGGMVERCINASVDKTSLDIAHSPLKFSLSASAAIQYRLFRNVSLYLEPDFSYYLSKPESFEKYRQDHKASFTVRSGFFINFAQ